MSLYNSFLTGTQIWFTSGVFVAALAMFGLDTPQERIGTIPLPNDQQENIQRLFEIQLSEMLHMEEHMLSHIEELVDRIERADLKKAMEQHRKETAPRADRIRAAFEAMDAEASAVPASAFEGMLTDHEQLISTFNEPSMRDEAIIASARKFTQYKIACYQNLVHTAGMLEFQENVVGPLEESLREEQEMERTLASLSEQRRGRNQDADVVRPHERDELPRQRQIKEQ